MANKPRKISPAIMEEVYTGLGIVLMQQPEGAGPHDIWEALFKDRLSTSSVSTAISELERNGYVKFVGRKGQRKKFVLTDKEFNLSPTMALDGSSTSARWFEDKKPKPKPQAPSESPADPQYWLNDLNKVLDGLCSLQEAIPGLKAGLLDLTKNLERLAKVKDILSGIDKAARRNV